MKIKKVDDKPMVIHTKQKAKPDVKVCFEISANMKAFGGFTELTPEIIRAFIKRITFFGDDRIEIEYTFTDYLEQLDELIEERKMLCGIM